jgi:hypothetical protein
VRGHSQGHHLLPPSPIESNLIDLNLASFIELC